MCGHATQHGAGLLRLYIVVGCQALLRMSPKAKAAPGAQQRLGEAVHQQFVAVRDMFLEGDRELAAYSLIQRWASGRRDLSKAPYR